MKELKEIRVDLTFTTDKEQKIAEGIIDKLVNTNKISSTPIKDAFVIDTDKKGLELLKKMVGKFSGLEIQESTFISSDEKSVEMSSTLIMDDFRKYIEEAKLSDFKKGDRVMVTKRDEKSLLSPGQKGTVSAVGTGPKFNLVTIDTDDTISKMLGLPFISPTKLKKIK